MKHNNKYVYPKTIRVSIDGKRHYDINDKEKLPSVTTILSKTSPAEKEEGLRKWREKMGEENATRIVDEAAARGTAMHKILENYILKEGYLDLTNVGKDAHNMAMKIIADGLCNITEYYGLESTLYYPGLYAGATDMIALHKNKMAIVDFKQTNKPKKREWIEDYCLHLAAYGMAHDYMHKTQIDKAVIMMCSKDNYYQEFVIEGEEYRQYKYKWLGRVSKYYEQRNRVTSSNEETK